MPEDGNLLQVMYNEKAIRQSSGTRGIRWKHARAISDDEARDCKEATPNELRNLVRDLAHRSPETTIAVF